MTLDTTVWDEYLAPIPESERGDMIKAYYSRLTSDDPKVRAEAGRAWSRWEMATSRIEVDEAYLKRADEPGFADAFARIGEFNLALAHCYLPRLDD